MTTDARRGGLATHPYPRPPSAVALGVWLLACATPNAVAQELTPDVRLGVQFVVLNTEDLGYGQWGIGGLATFDIAPPLAIDIEIEAYVENPPGYGGDIVMLAGPRLKHRMGRNALFLKLLPGAMWFRSNFLTSRNPDLSVRPTVEVGVGFERALSERIAFRFDLTDGMMFFGNDEVFTGTVDPTRPGVVHCPGLGIGIMISLGA